MEPGHADDTMESTGMAALGIATGERETEKDRALKAIAAVLSDREQELESARQHVDWVISEGKRMERVAEEQLNEKEAAVCLVSTLRRQVKALEREVAKRNQRKPASSPPKSDHSQEPHDCAASHPRSGAQEGPTCSSAETHTGSTLRERHAAADFKRIRGELATAQKKLQAATQENENLKDELAASREDHRSEVTALRSTLSGDHQRAAATWKREKDELVKAKAALDESRAALTSSLRAALRAAREGCAALRTVADAFSGCPVSPLCSADEEAAPIQALDPNLSTELDGSEDTATEADLLFAASKCDGAAGFVKAAAQALLRRVPSEQPAARASEDRGCGDAEAVESAPAGCEEAAAALGDRGQVADVVREEIAKAMLSMLGGSAQNFMGHQGQDDVVVASVKETAPYRADEADCTSKRGRATEPSEEPHDETSKPDLSILDSSSCCDLVAAGVAPAGLSVTPSCSPSSSASPDGNRQPPFSLGRTSSPPSSYGRRSAATRHPPPSCRESSPTPPANPHLPAANPTAAGQPVRRPVFIAAEPSRALPLSATPIWNLPNRASFLAPGADHRAAARVHRQRDSGSPKDPASHAKGASKLYWRRETALPSPKPSTQCITQQHGVGDRLPPYSLGASSVCAAVEDTVCKPGSPGIQYEDSSVNDTFPGRDHLLDDAQATGDFYVYRSDQLAQHQHQQQQQPAARAPPPGPRHGVHPPSPRYKLPDEPTDFPAPISHRSPPKPVQHPSRQTSPPWAFP
eukprot:gene15690-23950_t